MSLSETLLWLRAVLFTVLVPGTVTVVLPFFYILKRRFPVAEVRWGAVEILGAVLLAIGAGIYFRCLWDFVRQGHGIPSPVDHPKRLVVRGLYRYIRNPMYVGVVLVLLGESALFRSAGLLRYTLFWMVVFHLVILIYEEPNLRARFGESYLDYCKHVGRWIPGRPYRDGSLSSRRTS